MKTSDLQIKISESPFLACPATAGQR